jgi:hypothetical protein
MYIDRTVYIPVEVRNQTVESYPIKLADKVEIIKITSDFSLRSNKPAPHINGILIAPLFQTCDNVSTPGDFALAKKIGK